MAATASYRENVSSNLKEKNLSLKTIIFILTLFLLTGQFSFGQTYSSIISDKEIYDFLNTLIQSDQDRISKQLLRKISVNPKISRHWDSTYFFRPKATEDFQKILTDDFDYIFWGNEIDSLLNENDRKFMFEQYKSFKDTIWHQPFIGTRLESKIKKKMDRYYFCIPIFSVDKKVVIIYFSNYCGELCGFGGYYIYKRTLTNKWKFVTVRGHWIS